jgi:hypothetical protein
MRRAAFFLLGLLLSLSALAAGKLPGESEKYLPQLGKEVSTYWPALTIREFPAGVIDQESNWKLNATLRTKREFGCGLGQFTIAYNADGSVRFNAVDEAKHMDRSLSGWDVKNCYEVTYQLRAVVLKLKMHSRNCSAYMRGDENSYKCAGGQYNGGAGSTTKRIRSCRATPGCEPSIWDANLDRQCPQSNVRVEGYGESFCEINSKYPARVWARMPKFRGLV